jgi:signal transduction histidine kinase/CheY-like chemotaxis protein
MTPDLLHGESVFLTSAQPDRSERRLALAVLLVSCAIFMALAPFAKVPLAKVTAFIPIYEAALTVNDVITASLLFTQFSIVRSRALLILASGYVFTAVMTIIHALTFPGLFSTTGLLGAGPQSTAWIYMLWHCGFPLFVVAYAVASRPRSGTISSKTSSRTAILSSIVAACVTACGLGVLTTAGADILPPIMQGNSYGAMGSLLSLSWMLTLISLAVLWRRRPHSVLDLWLLVVMCAWLFDIALSAVLNAGRYDLGFYAGRVYGLLAASFVLLVLLFENGRLYAQLAGAHRRERLKTASLLRLSTRLEAVNTMLADKSGQLQKASQLKSEFMASMSHELRTPLNAIIGFSEVLKDGLAGELPPKQHEYITDIFSSGQHLLSLINDILDLSKIEAGKMTLDLEPIDIEAVLRNGLSIVREKAAYQHIRLALEIPEPLGEMAADARKTRQIVYNLLSNAVKFTPPDGIITLSARNVDRLAVDDWASSAPTSMRLPLPAGNFDQFIEISVTDTGHGIEPHQAPRLFQAFSQLEHSLNRTTDGTGLGLALTLNLALLHGGTVALASTPGQGSCFTIWLPQRSGPAHSAASQPAVSDTAADHRFALVVEDNDQAAELISLQLKPEGFEVLRASTAEQALGLLATRPPQIVILNVLLPDMDGWDLLALIKHANSRLSSIPVVIVSIVADVQKGLSLGAAQVLQKPVARDELLLTLEGLGLRSRPDPLEALMDEAQHSKNGEAA